MEFKIQSLVFPKETIHLMCRDLFFTGNTGYFNLLDGFLYLGGPGQSINLATYLNGCVWTKWKKYTNATSCKLKLRIQGKFVIMAVGYHLEQRELSRRDFGCFQYDFDFLNEIEIVWPDNDEVILGIEVLTISDCKILSGEYYVEVDDDIKLNPVDIALVTTTFKKEEYIKKNVELIKNEILNCDDEIRDHLDLYVIDNGRTLSESDVFAEEEHIHLCHNKNAGGSGGFARGMLEALHQDKPATHVLLMDDDVVVLAQSIYRTYSLLRLLKEEYKDYFFNGAMLKLERPSIQHEDVGTITGTRVESLKPEFDMTQLLDVVCNDGCYYSSENQYGSWWYCCIPISVIKQNGLPLPLFVRLDDLEYSLRCHARFLTMGGICIWHMGFEYKYNIALEYQSHRNFLIMHAIHPQIQRIDYYADVMNKIRTSMIKFDYSAMNVLMRSVKDYLKGPEFIKNADGERILRENNKENDVYEKISSHPELRIKDINDCWHDEPWNEKDDIWMNKTDNGQKRGRFRYKNSPMPLVPMGDVILWSKVTRRREYAVINTFDETVTFRKKDKKLYRSEMKKLKALKAEYEEKHDVVDRMFREEFQNMISEDFWIKYLEL